MFCNLSKPIMEINHIGDLYIDGNGVMQVTGKDAGQRVGWILDILLHETKDGICQNLEEDLRKRTVELAKLDDEELRRISQPKSSSKSSSHSTQLIGKVVNYSLIILGTIGIIYFVSTGKVIGL